MTEPTQFKFSFYQDDNVLEELTYAEFLKRPELLKRMDDKDYYKLILGRDIYQFSYKFLNGDKELTKLMTEFERINKATPIYFFAPQSQQALDFLNDDAHDVLMAMAPNGVGKTCLATVKVIINSIPCDPNWWMFKKYGVKVPEWQGPMKVGLATDTWRKQREVIWPEFQRWMPDKELGAYGKTYAFNCKRDNPNWKDNPLIVAKCKSRFSFFCYEQSQSAFSSNKLNLWLWDEQPPRSRFDEADERTRRLNGKHYFSVTPAKEEGRPDTGADSFITEMARGERVKGHNVCRYNWGVPDVPHWIYPEAQKKAAYEKHVLEPIRTGDRRAQREGRARYYGEPQTSSGVIYDEWTPELHIIDDDPKLLEGCTLYRAIDIGYENPTACLWAAVDRNYNVILYREYYERKRDEIQNAEAIIKASGNKRESLGAWTDSRNGVIYQKFEEVETGEVYAKTVLDGRSFEAKALGRAAGKIYQDAGIRVQPASCAQSPKQIAAVRELLKIRPDRKHIVTGELGASMLVVFRSLRWFRWEIERYINEEWGNKEEYRNEKEKPRDKDNHLMTAAAYLAQIPMRYLGPMKPWNRATNGPNGPSNKPRSSITGY